MKLYPVFILSTLSFLGLCYPRQASSQNISGVVNTYHRVTAINTATNTLTLSSVAGISPGVKVLVIQMKGATIDNSNSSSFGNITAIGNAGNYEFNYVCAVNGNDVMLMFSLLRSYTVSGIVQVVTVPQYTAAVITDTLKAAPWDPVTGTGGIIAIEASNSITLTRPINASGIGFRGGAYLDHPQPPYNCDFSTNITAFGFSNPASGYQTGGSKGEGITGATGIECGKGKLANGGGGANNHNSGGAGGGGYAAGGPGGQRSNEGAFNCHGANPGLGGLALSAQGYTPANNRVFLGGGGGAGHGNNNVGMPGGNGGGIVFIKADTLYGNSELIRANGARPYRADLADPYSAGGDGGGGGGGGGVIVADVVNYSGNVNFEARGGDGSYSSYTPSPGCFGPGGGGGGGVLWIRGGALAPGLGTSLNGGANGLISVTTSVAACRGLANGATAGGNGNVALNYVAPLSTSPVCIPLPLQDLVYFSGKETAGGVSIQWKMRNTRNVNQYEVERSIDKLNFETVSIIQNSFATVFDITDKDAPAEFVYYRLKITYSDGRKLHSSIILVQVSSRSALQLIRLSPVANNITATVSSSQQGTVEISIYSAGAQKLLTKNQFLRRGVNQLSFNIRHLPAGAYFFSVTMNGRRIAKSFLK
jgi:hypothetical protein